MLDAPVMFILPYPIELMSCEELHAILHLVLQAGNIMNAVSATVHLLYAFSHLLVKQYGSAN